LTFNVSTVIFGNLATKVDNPIVLDGTTHSGFSLMSDDFHLAPHF
jgi:hypothetical protein